MKKTKKKRKGNSVALGGPGTRRTGIRKEMYCFHPAREFLKTGKKAHPKRPIIPEERLKKHKKRSRREKKTVWGRKILKAFLKKNQS